MEFHLVLTYFNVKVQDIAENLKHKCLLKHQTGLMEGQVDVCVHFRVCHQIWRYVQYCQKVLTDEDVAKLWCCH